MTRLEKVKRMLATPAGMDRIASESGFLSANYMSRIFKRYTGLTPTQYRRQQMEDTL